MNTRTRLFVLILTLLGADSGALALTLPPAGDCDSMLAKGGTVWVGEFSGSYDDGFDHRYMLYRRGCFSSEYECRRWINGVQTAVEYPGLMRCRPAR